MLIFGYVCSVRIQEYLSQEEVLDVSHFLKCRLKLLLRELEVVYT